MAQQAGGESITVQVSERILGDNKEENCKCCKKLTVKISEIQMELSSCREIIRILQEEIRESSSHQATGNKGSEDTQSKQWCNLKRRGEWTIQASNQRRHPRYTRGHTHTQQLHLETSNHYSALANLNEDSEHPRNVLQSAQDQSVKGRSVKQSVKENQMGKQKLIIIGDSHARKSASELQHNIGSSFVVSSFIKPGAGMESIVNTMKEDIKKLKKDDTLIIWGGANDIGKNNSKAALKHLCNFIENNQKVNIIVMSAPPRYDLLPTSCVNSEVLRYNKQLGKRVKQFNNVKILETNLERKYFTKHGLHLNSSGKECISQRLATKVKDFFHTDHRSPIYLQWKKGTVITNQEERNKDPLVTNNHVESTPQPQNLNSSNELSADETASNKRNKPNQGSETSKETVGSRKQETATDRNDPRTNTDNTDNTDNKENGSDRKRSEFQNRTSNRTKKNPSERNGDFLWT